MTTPSRLPGFAAGEELPVYRVQAHNGSTESENKIHDDRVAKQYGFAGGLVPGVTDYAYMTRPLVEAFGLAWMERGSLSARFLKPIYEGDDVTVAAAVREVGEAAMELEVIASNSAGEICAAGMARMPVAPPRAPRDEDIPAAPRPASRPPASRESLAVGTVLGTIERVFGEGDYARYLDEAVEHYALYEGPRGVAPSGYLIREANRVLYENVHLGPWIHVSSEVQHHGLVRLGDHLATRATVVGLFERKGHEFVDLDVLIVANGERPVMRVAHRAIWDVRKKA